jgi:7,8-dihydro-6-hydroxymethylpterin-pyrophosphokinase
MQYIYLEVGSVSEIPLEMKQECYILAKTFVESRLIIESIDSILSDHFLRNKSCLFMLKLKSSVKLLLKQSELYDKKSILSTDDLMFINDVSETTIDLLDLVNSLKLLERLLCIVSCLHSHRSNLTLPDKNVNAFFF